MRIPKIRTGLLHCLAVIGRGTAQTQTEPDTAPERWNLFFQATAIGQYNGTFRSPYQGDFSLRSYPERDVSLTSTLHLGLRLFKNTQAYIKP